MSAEPVRINQKTVVGPPVTREATTKRAAANRGADLVLEFAAARRGAGRNATSARPKDLGIDRCVLENGPARSAVRGRRRPLPTRWLSPAPSGRGSVRMQARLRSRLMRKPQRLTATEGLRRIYF